jgi:hypothetical protein
MNSKRKLSFSNNVQDCGTIKLSKEGARKLMKIKEKRFYITGSEIKRLISSNEGCITNDRITVDPLQSRIYV